jgi:hypothetical protein
MVAKPAAVSFSNLLSTACRPRWLGGDERASGPLGFVPVRNLRM